MSLPINVAGSSHGGRFHNVSERRDSRGYSRFRRGLMLEQDGGVQRLLLDAKDLIELIERGAPMRAAEFTRWLDERDAMVVLTSTNVMEFAECLRHVDDLLYVRSILQTLETLPHVFLREVTIEVDEIALAISAYNSGASPLLPDPYVTRWDHTFAIRGEPPPGEMIVDYRLDLMVFDLMSQPDHRRSGPVRAALQAVTDDRAVPIGKRVSPRKALTGALQRKIAFWKLPPPSMGVEAFGKWVYADPMRCPGFRLAWEQFRAEVANADAVLRESDIWDAAHFRAIPYVEYVTLDRRMTGYCREIGRRLGRLNPAADCGKKAYRSLSALVNAIS